MKTSQIIFKFVILRNKQNPQMNNLRTVSSIDRIWLKNIFFFFYFLQT